MEINTTVVPHADIAVEFKVTSTMLTHGQVIELRNSLEESLENLIPDYKGGRVESTIQQKLLPSGLILVVAKSLYEAFIDGDKVNRNDLAG